MIEIRLHGRGGQGSVVATKILADAVVLGGGYVQAFPEFGVERRGSPVFAFVRIDDKPIFLRCKIYRPDHIVILDPTLLESGNITEGVKEGGIILINSPKNPAEFRFDGAFRVMTVDATAIAVKYRLGSKASPIVNTAILGAIVKALAVATFENLTTAIRSGITIKAEDNVTAAREAFESLRQGEKI